MKLEMSLVFKTKLNFFLLRMGDRLKYFTFNAKWITRINVFIHIKSNNIYTPQMPNIVWFVYGWVGLGTLLI